MADFILRVGRPKGRKTPWELPTPVEGETAHYLYDTSGKRHTALTRGSKVFLFGGSNAQVRGLFALATCVIPDDTLLDAELDHDAFVKVSFDKILEPPILADEAQTGGPDCTTAMNKLRTDSNLQMRKLSTEESAALHSFLMDRLSVREG